MQQQGVYRDLVSIQTSGEIIGETLVNTGAEAAAGVVA
jgi:hypothetical protein